MEEGVARTDDDVRLWFTRDGVGVPLVLCHGGPGMWDYLEPLASLLEGSHVIRWEQRGCGRSDRCGPYTVRRFIDDLDQLRAHLGYDRWIVGGHSWGATLALHYALAQPDRVDGLVYVSGVGVGRAWNAAYHREADRRLTPGQQARREELRRVERTGREEREFRALCWAPDFADRAHAVALAWDAAGSPFAVNDECNATLNAETKSWEERDLVARCAALDVPALIVHGACDPRPSWAVDSLAQALPRCDVHVLPDAGHQPWVESPGETAAVIGAFLEARGPHAG